MVVRVAIDVVSVDAWAAALLAGVPVTNLGQPALALVVAGAAAALGWLAVAAHARALPSGIR